MGIHRDVSLGYRQLIARFMINGSTDVSASDSSERRTNDSRESFEQALMQCRDEVARSAGMADGASPRRSVEAMVRAARRAEMPPERTLAEFKKMLLSLPEIARLPLDNRTDATRQLVQLAIDAYYDGKP